MGQQAGVTLYIILGNADEHQSVAVDLFLLLAAGSADEPRAANRDLRASLLARGFTACNN
jgi:hypothetical protein